MDEADAVRLRQGLADLTQDVNDPAPAPPELGMSGSGIDHLLP
ncbi:MAG: hypothetical protein ABI914_03695 [Acidobacteriota bacterium]